MDVKAMVLLGTQPPPAESAGGMPLALLDVLGRPVLHRVADRLYRYGISGVTVIDVGSTGSPGHPVLAGSRGSSQLARRALRPDLRWVPTAGRPPWRAAQRVFSELVQSAAELVIVLRFGPYAEIDFENLIQFHLVHRGRVTSVVDPEGKSLDTYVICGSRRNDAAFLFNHQLQSLRSPSVEYKFGGYVNRLAGPADLRALAIDAFSGRAQISPEGTEIKPGIWVADGARIHRGARLLAPVFIGERAKVRASAVVTRCSVVEHHAQVDCGTVVEDSTVLPYTAIGAGLDVAHSVVGFGRLAHLQRRVEVEISDPKLIGTIGAAPVRVLRSAALLASFLPVQFLRGVFRGGTAETPASVPSAVQSPSAALKSEPAVQAAEAVEPNQFPSSFVMARRYGDE